MTDPATVEIIRNRLHDIAEEMQASVMNSAYSPLWQEAGDLSCAVVTRDAEIVGQSERVIPVHIATMTSSLQTAIAETGGSDALQPGDVLLQNDPYAGNNHLPDFVMAQPVFVDETLLGFSAVRAHWVDVGGSSPTSYSTHTSEIYEEGLRVPPAKLFSGGDRNDSLHTVILANMRDRDERLGDMHAQLAGVRRGHERVAALAARYGPDTVRQVMAKILDNDEQRVRTRITELPNGTWTATDYLDGDGITDTPIGITGAVTVDGDRISVDFAGTDEQATGGVNSPIACTRAAVEYAVKVILDPGAPGTSGAYRPVGVTAPKGSVVNPTHPAPVVAGNHETATRIYDVVVQAMAQIDPNMTFGGGDGSSNVFNYRSLESGAINYTCMGGGMGACPCRDGINAIRSGVGNTGLQPVERIEEDYGFVTVEKFMIVPDTGGPGRQRGGNTARRVWRFDEPTQIVMTGERATSSPFGIGKGQGGTPARHVLITPDGEEIELDSKATTDIEAGSRVVFQPAGGGGVDDPLERPAAAVVDDVKDGYVSLESAVDDYGVVIDPTTLALQEDATGSQRARDE